MLGNYVYKYFQRTKTQISTIDGFRVTKESLNTIDTLLIAHGINNETCVINCIGKIPQRHNEADKEYYIVNGLFPHLLWLACKRHGAKMIQPATDCVFSGKKGQYVETDIHDETSHYGMSKSLGEPLECTIIRTSIIGREVQNKSSLVEFVFKNTGGTIKGWNNHLWNGITCLEYCKLIDFMIQKDLFWKGVRHILSPRAVSKYELLKLIKDTYALSVTIEEFTAPITIDKTLQTVNKDVFFIPDLVEQLKELALFEII